MDRGFLRKLIGISTVMLFLVLGGCSGVNKTPQTMSAHDFVVQGLSQLSRHELAAAEQTLDQLNTRFPFHAETGELYIAVIKGYYEAGQADAAIRLADQFIQMYPTHKDVAYAHYLAGMADYERGRRDISMDVTTSDPTYAKVALSRFRTLVACCSGTEHAFNAKQYIYHLESMISLYELRYMEWDYDADRIDAAAQRGISLLVSYPQSVAARRARMMLESDNFRRYRTEINRAIREAHPSAPVEEMAQVPEPEPRFAIHIASDSDLDALVAAMARLGLDGEVDYYREVDGDNAYYVAAFGRYVARDEAKTDRLKLRVRTENPDLWVRNIEDSQRIEDLDAHQAAVRATAVVEPAVTQVMPAATVDPVSEAASRDHEPTPFYAIQMMSFSDPEQLRHAVAAMGMEDEVGLYRHQVKGRTYFIALYGDYPSWEAGKAGLTELEQRTGKTDYWLRRIDGGKVEALQ